MDAQVCLIKSKEISLAQRSPSPHALLYSMHVLSRSEMVTESRGVGQAALGPVVPSLLTVEKKHLLLKRMALGEEIVIWKEPSGEVDLHPVVVRATFVILAVNYLF